MLSQKEKNKNNKPKDIILYGLDIGDYHQDIYGVFSTKQKLREAVEHLGCIDLYRVVKYKVDPLDPHFIDNMNCYSIHISKDGIIKNIRIENDFPDKDNFGFSVSEDLYYTFWALNEEQAINKINKLRLILLEKDLWYWSSFNRIQYERKVERKQLIKEVLKTLNND